MPRKGRKDATDQNQATKASEKTPHKESENGKISINEAQAQETEESSRIPLDGKPGEAKKKKEASSKEIQKNHETDKEEESNGKEQKAVIGRKEGLAAQACAYGKSEASAKATQ